MPTDGHFLRVYFITEVLLDEGGEFLGDVCVHVVVFFVEARGSVEVKTGAGAEVPAVVFAFDVGTAGGGVCLWICVCVCVCVLER